MSNEQRSCVKICVLTENIFLFQKIRLELSGDGECFMCSDSTIPGADVYIVDADCQKFAKSKGLTMSYKDEDADIRLPFKLGALRELIFGKGKNILSLDSEKRCVHLGARVISLTDVELALFTAIYNRGGEFASRETLLKEVWSGTCDSGVINVYVHYLREKLECEGEKIILCSRKSGYAISKKYIGGSEDA